MTVFFDPARALLRTLRTRGACAEAERSATVVTAIVPISSLIRPSFTGPAPLVMTQVSAPTAAAPQAATRKDPLAAAVALAPNAMAALLRAQEHIDADGDGAGRQQSAQEIDRLIAQMADTPPPAPPVHLSASEGFALQMLLGARQQLRELYA